ncbi:MAG: hypothetical protein QNK37_02025 [Acidobacteriota bacterium]|nr:hypothetical protein [Acidobacteriota bacterium]
MVTHDYITEKHIIDRYVMDKLSREERALFEDHFITCNECMDALELAQSFREGLKKEAVKNAAQVVKMTFLARLLSARGMRITSVLLAAALLFMVFQPPNRVAVTPDAEIASAVFTLEAARGEDDLVKVRSGDTLSQPIEPGLEYTRYQARIVDEKGKSHWSRSIEGKREVLEITVYLPGKAPGTYSLVIEAAEEEGEFEFYNQYSFQLVRP